MAGKMEQRGICRSYPQICRWTTSKTFGKTEGAAQSDTRKERSMEHRRGQELIFREFGIEYTPKQVRAILKKLDMKQGKPYPYDYRRPESAEDDLKNSRILMEVW
jgi:putative transposase